MNNVDELSSSNSQDISKYNEPINALNPLFDEFMAGKRKFTLNNYNLNFKFVLATSVIDFTIGPNTSPLKVLPDSLYVGGLSVTGAKSQHTLKFSSFYIPTNPTESSSWATMYNYRSIMININPFTPYGLLTLAHEEGHLIDFKRLLQTDRQLIEARSAAKKKSNLNERLTPIDVQIILDSERIAWTLALMKLRPFFSNREHPDLTFANAQDFIHNYALGSYERSLARKLTDTLDSQFVD